MNLVPVGLAEVDLQGRVRSANERFCELIERSPESVRVRGLALGDVLDGSDRPAFEQALEQFELGCAPFVQEVRVTTPGRRSIWLELTASPLPSGPAKPQTAVIAATDITDRKTHERANQVKDEFLSILSHELRTPLNAVLGWVHVLRTSATSETQLDRGLTVIERNARLQSRMVDDLLDMSGVIAGKMRLEKRAVPIGRVVDGVVEGLLPAFAEKGVTVDRSSVAHAGTVDGDASRLHQVFWNLLANALKFTAAGGRVSVCVDRDDDEVRVIVSDNGQGIEPSFLPFVFERFRQGDGGTRRTHGGLGIGLALVKSLTELHGGRVAVASDGPGRGATFTVTLPLIADIDRAEPGEVRSTYA